MENFLKIVERAGLFNKDLRVRQDEIFSILRHNKSGPHWGRIYCVVRYLELPNKRACSLNKVGIRFWMFFPPTYIHVLIRDVLFSKSPPICFSFGSLF